MGSRGSLRALRSRLSDKVVATAVSTVAPRSRSPCSRSRSTAPGRSWTASGRGGADYLGRGALGFFLSRAYDAVNVESVAGTSMVCC